MSGAELDRSRQLDVLDLDKGATISERAYYAYNLTTVVKGTLELKVKQLLFEPDRRDENVIKEGSPQHFRICFSLRKISSYNIIDSAKEDKEKAKREKERMREEKRIKKLSLIQEVTADEGEDGHITYRSDDIEIRNASKRDTGSSRSSVDEDRKSSPKSKHSSRSSSRRSSKEMERKSEERERSGSISSRTSLDSNRSLKKNNEKRDKQEKKEKKDKKLGKEIILQIHFTSNKPHHEHHGKVLHFVFKKKTKKFKKILLRLRELTEKYKQERMTSSYMVDTMASPGDMQSPSSLSRSGFNFLRDSNSESETGRLPYEELKPKLHGESKILNQNNLKQIWRYLPFRLKIKDWSLLYSDAVHGASLSTFYRKIEGKGPTVLLIKDTGGYVFGAYITEEWKKSDSFYGLGENFLFSLEPTPHVYYWTKQNDFFHISNEEFFAFGGGKAGKYGLYVDKELHKGTSEITDTFLNRPLASKEHFSISVIEVWTFAEKS
jgi:hypothetical protein